MSDVYIPFESRQCAQHRQRWDFGTHCYHARRLLAKHPEGVSIRQAQTALALPYKTAKAVLMAVAVKKNEKFYLGG